MSFQPHYPDQDYLIDRLKQLNLSRRDLFAIEIFKTIYATEEEPVKEAVEWADALIEKLDESKEEPKMVKLSSTALTAEVKEESRSADDIIKSVEDFFKKD